MLTCPILDICDVIIRQFSDLASADTFRNSFGISYKDFFIRVIQSYLPCLLANS